jgi:hypothetical protein
MRITQTARRKAGVPEIARTRGPGEAENGAAEAEKRRAAPATA